MMYSIYIMLVNESWIIIHFFQQGTITLILATDMARHGEILDSFKQKVDNFDFRNEEHVTCVSFVYSI